jgi:hypothetical protein
MQTDIDRHSPVPSLNSSQPPDPPHFSLLTTFNQKLDVFPVLKGLHFKVRSTLSREKIVLALSS